MTQELVSLTIIMAVAAVSPIVAQLIPNPPGEIVGGEILYKGQDLVKNQRKICRKSGGMRSP